MTRRRRGGAPVDPSPLAGGPEAALVQVDLIERGGELAAFRYLPAVRADLLARLGRDADAARAFEQAIGLADHEVERDHLRGRLEALRRAAGCNEDGGG